MINLYFSNGKTFVWNAKDICTLRREHHIVGSLVGSYPIKPFQIQTKWLPLQLMPEEVKLLVDKGLAQLVSIPQNVTDQALAESFLAQRDKLCEDQISLLKENRKQQILEKADQIYEGKKRKYLEALSKSKKTQKTTEGSDISVEENKADQTTSSIQDKSCSEGDNSNSFVECEENPGIVCNIKDSGNIKEKSSSESLACDSEVIDIDKNTLIEAELAKVTGVNKELCLVQLFTECPWKEKVIPVDCNYPSSEKEKLRYAVYKDLWEKNYYITTGTKFGGDFLAYEGDPLKYHALFIVICMCRGQRFQGYDLVVYGRLGHQVKKTVALASLDDDDKVEYISLSWENEMT